MISYDITLIGPLAKTAPQPLQGLIYYIDGGARWRDQAQGMIVGDNDSWKGDKKQFDHLLPVDKNESDFAYTLGLLSGNSREILTHGLWGGRFDHQLAILGDTNAWLLSNTGNRIWFTQENKFTAAFFNQGNWSFDFHGTFSLFSFAKEEIEMDGKVKYPLSKNHQFKTWSSHGLSNNARGIFEIQTTGPTLLVFEADENM